MASPEASPAVASPSALEAPSGAANEESDSLMPDGSLAATQTVDEMLQLPEPGKVGVEGLSRKLF